MNRLRELGPPIRARPSRRAFALALAAAAAGCKSRPELPQPELPLTRTPDADFRRRAPAPFPVEAPEVRAVATRRLANGLTVQVVEREGLPLVSTRLVVRGAGSERETERSGLGALTALMLMHGTRLPDGRVAQTLRILGREPALDVDRGAMSARLDVTASSMRSAVALLAKLVTAPAFSPEALPDAANELLDSIAQQSRRIETHLKLAAFKHLYGAEHPLARPVLGTSDGVAGIGLPSVVSYYASHYTPNVTAFIVVGDVRAEEVFAVVESELGGWSAPPRAPAFDPIPEVLSAGETRPIVAFATGNVLARAVLVVPGPGANASDSVPFELAMSVLSGHALSRANRALSFHEVKSYGVSHEILQRAESSDSVLSFSVEPEDLPDSVTSLFQQMELLRQRPLDEVELARARARFEGKFRQSLAQNTTFAELLGTLFAHGRGPEEIARFGERVARVTSQDLQQAARGWLRPDRIQLSVAAAPAYAHRPLSSLGTVQWLRLESTVIKHGGTSE